MIWSKNKRCHLYQIPIQSFNSITRENRETSSHHRDPTIFISFLDQYLDSGVVGRAALGEEAEGGVEPHHVVPLEPVLVGPDQQRLVRVSVPPADRGEALTHRRDQRQLAGMIDTINTC